MALTKTEKLWKKLGKKVNCDCCHAKKTFNLEWRMTKNRKAVCPDCSKYLELHGELLVSI